MRRSALLIVGCAAVVGFDGLANASMIGDVLTVNRFYPDLATIYDPPLDAIPGFITVTAVVGPEASPSSPQPTLYSIDFEANSISFDFLAPSSFVGKPGPGYSLSSPFDGLQFLGFSQSIQNVTVGSVSGISVTELFFGADYIDLNLNGGFTADSSLVLSVEFDNAVPEPSSALLLGTTLAASWVLRRRRRVGPNSTESIA
jgi:hypothetical protein